MTRPGNDVATLAPQALMNYSAQAGSQVALPEHDSWLYIFAQTVQFAEYVQNTDFVPKAIRGNPPAIVATVMAGHEAHLGPIASFKYIFTVHGRVSQLAELMRAQALQAGHEIDFPEPTNTKAVIRGRRRPIGEWVQVTFTADQAKFAGIDLGKYPADKLFARASSRLCRRIFADCISGLPSVEEVEDAALEESGAGATAAATASPSNRRRRAPLNLATPPETAVQPQREASQTVRPSQPPLPFEEEATPAETPEVAPVQEAEEAEVITTAEEEAEAIDEAQRAAAEPGSVSPQQLKALGATFTSKLKLGGKDNDEARHLLTSAIVREHITTWSELSYDQAGEVLRVTNSWPKGDELEGIVDSFINAGIVQFGDEPTTDDTEGEQ